MVSGDYLYVSIFFRYTYLGTSAEGGSSTRKRLHQRVVTLKMLVDILNYRWQQLSKLDSDWDSCIMLQLYGLGHGANIFQ